MTAMNTANLLYHDKTRAIIGCIYEVFNSLPRFAEEALYQEALEIALADAGITFEAQKEIHPSFHGRKLTHTYRPDIICHECIVVELKAVSQLLPEHYGQLRNYMGMLGLRVGLLVNFHATPIVEVKRLYLADMADAGQVSTQDARDGAAAEAEEGAFADAGRRDLSSVASAKEEAAIRPGGRNASPLPPPRRSPTIVVP